MFVHSTNVTVTELRVIGNVLVQIVSIRNATIKDCYFKGQQFRGAITVIDSVLSLVGNVTFIDNCNYGDGGAISLYGNSAIYIPEPNSTYILFENNTLHIVREGHLL